MATDKRLGWWDTIAVRAARRGRTCSLALLLFDTDGELLDGMRGCLSNHGDSILYIACFENHADTVTRIVGCSKLSAWLVDLNHGYEDDDTLFSTDRLTPLGVACLMGHADVVDVLLQHGAGVVCVNESGDSALEVAFLYFKYGTLTCDDTTVWIADASRIVRALVRDGGANVDDDFTDYNLLDVPITCTLLLKCCLAYTDPQRGEDAECGVWSPCKEQRAWLLSFIAALLREGAAVNSFASDGSSPLSVAYSKRCTPLIRMLEQRADVPEVMAPARHTRTAPQTHRGVLRRLRRNAKRGQRLWQSVRAEWASQAS